MRRFHISSIAYCISGELRLQPNNRHTDRRTTIIASEHAYARSYAGTFWQKNHEYEGAWPKSSYRLTQWSILTNCGLFFHNSIPCCPHTFSIGVWIPAWYSSSHPDPRKVLNCIITLSPVWYCFPAKCFFSCWGTENSQMVPTQENMEDDQPVQSHSQPQQPLQPQTCVWDHCPGETGLRQFSRPFWNVSPILLFKVLNYLSSVGLSGRKQWN